MLLSCGSEAAAGWEGSREGCAPHTPLFRQSLKSKMGSAADGRDERDLVAVVQLGREHAELLVDGVEQPATVGGQARVAGDQMLQQPADSRPRRERDSLLGTAGDVAVSREVAY